MTESLHLAGSFATVWLLSWLLCLIVLALAYSVIETRRRRWHPTLAANLLLILLACPFLLSLVSSVLLFLPGTESALVSPHCHADCQAHAPLIDVPWLAESGLLSILLITITMGRQLSGNVKAAAGLNSRLALLASARHSYYVLNDPQPFVFTLGWWQNRIYLTQGLLQQCSDRDLAIILAHEQAHVRRRDNVRLLLARLFLLPLPRRLRQRLFGELHLLIESACDFSAATHHGAVNVATTLLHVQKLIPNQWQLCQANVTSAFTGSEVEERIHTLLDSPRESRWQKWGLQLSVVGLLCLSLGLVDPLHHGIELLIRIH